MQCSIILHKRDSLDTSYFINNNDINHKFKKQDAQLSQRDRAVEWVSYGPKFKTGTGRQYLQTL